MKRCNTENVLLCKEFSAECERFSALADKYRSEVLNTYNRLVSETAYKEYSSGGEMLTRGYYCPSPIRDIVTSNCKRGKKLSRITSNSNPSYEYCFDENDRLIVVYYRDNNAIEVLDYIGDDTVIGVTFLSEPEFEIVSVVECKYTDDGRIVSFIRALSSLNDCVIDEIEKETYIYDKEGLFIAEDFYYLHQDASPILNYYRYKFKHNDEGYLDEYLVETSDFENDIYKVSVKRKI